MGRRAPYVLFIGFALLAAGVLTLLLGGGEDPPPVARTVVPAPPGATGQAAEPFVDPFSYDPGDRETFEARAAAGNAHLLYALSPGGAEATAARVARWRPQVEAAADEAGVEADLLEALVFLESAGRDDAVTPAGTEGAAGLTQIVAETAVNLLGMEVDVERSRRYARRIQRAARRGRTGEVERLERARRRVDDRFDPAKALAGTARYLQLALEKFEGREELAFVSYHMGMGNLEDVLRLYAGDEAWLAAPYAQVYFDSSPLRHRAAYDKLASLGDDSSNYLWKLHAAREIMRLHREDPEQLERVAILQTAKNSSEELLHPEGETPRFQTEAALREAWDDGALVPFPDDPQATGLRLDPAMGELARRLDRPVSLYRGLRPEALALALYVGAQVRAVAGDPRATLTVTSTVRDGDYQRALLRRNPEATRNYSLHTTGWTFDVLRRYRSRRHALAFQFVLDRLRALNVIAWLREPAAIHITAARDAEALLPLLDRIETRP